MFAYGGWMEFRFVYGEKGLALNYKGLVMKDLLRWWHNRSFWGGIHSDDGRNLTSPLIRLITNTTMYERNYIWFKIAIDIVFTAFAGCPSTDAAPVDWVAHVATVLLPFAEFEQLVTVAGAAESWGQFCVLYCRIEVRCVFATNLLMDEAAPGMLIQAYAYPWVPLFAILTWFDQLSCTRVLTESGALSNHL